MYTLNGTPYTQWVPLYPNGYTSIPKWYTYTQMVHPIPKWVHPYTQMGTPNYQP
jgi:hypothetical protein